MDDDDDRISQLPEPIAHHVLSFLKKSPKELVRMSVLSKNWFAITAAFPNLDFNMDNFSRDINASGILYDISHVKNMFFKYVGYTTSRFCNQPNIGTSVYSYTFNLNGVPLENPSQLSIVGRCIRLILRKGSLQMLKININTVGPLPNYRLPNTLLSVSSLSSLIIRHCELPLSLMVDDDDDDSIKFKSLKLLHLESLKISEQVIKRLTTCCPLLEKFKLLDCHGFKRFCIGGFQNLQVVEIYFKVEVERIDIDAPNLWYLFLLDLDGRGVPCMNLASCKKLTTLVYSGNPLPKLRGSADFLSNFPFIEKLLLVLSRQCKLKLSSHSLRTLMLLPCREMKFPCWEVKRIDIDTPNLLLFKYSLTCKVSELLATNSTKSEAQMEWFPTVDVNALWFQELRRFLSRTTRFFKVLKLNICSRFIDVEQLKVIHSPPFQLEHVDLELGRPGTIKELSVYAAAVDAVLWCLRPRSLTLNSDFRFLDFEQRSHIVKFTYEKLLQQEDEARTNIQILLSISSSKDKKYFNDLNSLLAALPRDPLRHIITLIKEDPSSCGSSSRMHETQEPVGAETSMSGTKKETSMRIS